MGKKKKKQRFHALVTKNDIQTDGQSQEVKSMSEDVKQKRLLSEKRGERKDLIT